MLRFHSVRTLLLVLAVSLFACKGKPKPQAAPGSGKVELAGVAGPHEIELPRSDGSPPVKTTAPVKPETFKKMSEMTFKGFTGSVEMLQPNYMHVFQRIPESPVIRVSIHIWTCAKDPGGCFPIDLEDYKAKHMDVLRHYLSEEVAKAADTVFETGMTDVNGAKVIYAFQLGQVMGDMHSEFTYAYILFYNDGENEIRILAEYKDDMMKGKEAMLKAVPKEDLLNTAKAFLDVYTHRWQE